MHDENNAMPIAQDNEVQNPIVSTVYPAQTELISVIIPACNAGQTIADCLGALLAQDYPALELVVVDDASSDATAQIATGLGVRVVANRQRMGSAGARNRGVEASSGALLLFVDSDVVVPPDAVSRAYAALCERPDCLAVGGLYSTNSGHLNFVSDYKNLDLSFRGGQSVGYNSYLATYFALVLRSSFDEAGGFSPDYSVEDIEFFYRVSKGSRNLYLCRDIVVDHLKRYTLAGMLKTNNYRIAGMMKIISDSRGTFKAGEAAGFQYLLNILVPNLILAVCIVSVWLRLIWPVLVMLTFFVVNNTMFLTFVRRHRGIMFACGTVLLLFLEYLLVPWSIASAYLRLRYRG